jgi:hypothetical protein
MAGDLVSGGYPVNYSFASLTGLARNASQGNVTVRSNAEWFGLGNPTDGALAATGVGCAVAIPVQWGDVITKITILAGATAEATGTHMFAALYSGLATPALMAQSADDTGAASVAASAAFVYTLASAQTITATNCPYGFVYASIAVTATTVPTAMVVSTPTAIGYKWFTNGPLFLSATHGSALGATAAATIASPSAKAVAPIVFLS